MSVVVRTCMHRREWPALLVSAILLLLSVPVRAEEAGAEASLVGQIDTGLATEHEIAVGIVVADRVMRALDLLGTPYRKGGAAPETGFDCSGFVRYVFSAADGIVLPRTADEMFRLAAQEIPRDAIEPGDLLFFRIGRLGKRIDHVAIAAGDGRFVHAPASGGVVRVDSLSLTYWQQRFAGARRLLPPAPLDDGPDTAEPTNPRNGPAEPTVP